MKKFLAAVRFLTIVPVPGGAGTAETDIAGSLPFFPVVGLLLGGVSAATAFGLSAVASPLVTAAVLVSALAAFSGAFHLDGLSDTADGFLSSRPKERILEIMKDSHIGAMGTVAVVLVLVLKFAAIASTTGANLTSALFLAPLAGRCSMVALMALVPYAREEGLGKLLYRGRRRAAAAWAAAVLLGGCMLAAGVRGLAPAAAAAAVVLAVAFVSKRRIGGATGDVFGAACELAETAVLTVMSLSVGAS